MKALILGGAESLWTDLAAVKRIVDPWPGIVIATNHAGIHYKGHVDHWVSMHPEDYFVKGPKVRAELGGNLDALTWTCSENGKLVRYAERVAHHWRLPNAKGSSRPTSGSGILAINIALTHLATSHNVLCGMPMDDSRHFDRPGRWSSADNFWAQWLELARLDRFGDTVRSMSGRSRDFFGAPTREWLDSEPARPYGGTRFDMEPVFYKPQPSAMPDVITSAFVNEQGALLELAIGSWFDLSEAERIVLSTATRLRELTKRNPQRHYTLAWRGGGIVISQHQQRSARAAVGNGRCMGCGG